MPLSKYMLGNVNWINENKSKLNLNKNTTIFFEENAFQQVVCEMVAFLSWPQSIEFYNFVFYFHFHFHFSGDFEYNYT